MTFPWQRSGGPPPASGTVAQSFFRRWSNTPGPDAAGLELLPDRLMLAAAAELGATDAGISVIGEHLRVPLGASSEPAALAERLQFTVGDGPCLAALHAGAPVQAGQADLASRWPVLFQQLSGHSPYRSVLSVPTDVEGTGAAMDLYFTDPDGPGGVDLDDAVSVSVQIGDVLTYTARLGEPTAADQEPAGPPWLQGAAPTRRMAVWVAIGMTSQHLQLPAADALAVLRAYAYSHDTDVDDLATDLTARAVTLEQLAAG